MGLFDGFFSKKEAPKLLNLNEQPTPPKNENKSFSFNTSFGTIGKGDLSKPFVSTYLRGKNGMIYFGKDNLFPSLSIQLIYSSPLTANILQTQTNACIGGGFEILDGDITATGKLNKEVFLKKNNIERELDMNARDFAIHDALYACIYFKDGKPVRFKMLGGEKVRHNEDRSLFMISDDFSRGTQVETIKAYRIGCTDEKQIYTIYRSGPGQIYALPFWTSAHNYAFLEGEIPFLQKSNIQESIYPSMFIGIPYIPASDEEKKGIRDMVESGKGANEAGRVMLAAAPNKDLLPVITPIPANSNDKLFDSTQKDIRAGICSAWSINPIILGVDKDGGGISIGEGELRTAYTQWEKNKIKPLRKELEYFYNGLMDIFNIQGKFKIINYQIIADMITDVTTNK